MTQPPGRMGSEDGIPMATAPFSPVTIVVRYRTDSGRMWANSMYLQPMGREMQGTARPGDQGTGGRGGKIPIADGTGGGGSGVTTGRSVNGRNTRKEKKITDLSLGAAL